MERLIDTVGEIERYRWRDWWIQTERLVDTDGEIDRYSWRGW